MTSDRDFTALGGETVFAGNIITVRVERFAFADGVEVSREIVRHRGAVAIVAHDDLHVWLVCQPREAVGDPDVLEIPAGKLDHEGMTPLQTAQLELAEEIGKAAGTWESLGSFWSSVGVMDEEVHLFLATDLSEASADSGELERIEIVTWPLHQLDELLEEVRDAKTRIGLLELARRRSSAV
jgi:8-oxo-dGTP pyrophosphatase MutT (NUDIX family)